MKKTGTKQPVKTELRAKYFAEDMVAGNGIGTKSVKSKEQAIRVRPSKAFALALAEVDVVTVEGKKYSGEERALPGIVYMGGRVTSGVEYISTFPADFNTSGINTKDAYLKTKGGFYKLEEEDIVVSRQGAQLYPKLAA